MKRITNNGLQYFLNNDSLDLAILGKQHGNKTCSPKTYLIMYQKDEQIIALDDISVSDKLCAEVPLPRTIKSMELFGKKITIRYDGMVYFLEKKD